MNKKQKIVQLKEENLINIIKRIVKEQKEDGLSPYPPKQPEEKIQPNLDNKVKYGTPEAILKGKKIVRHHLQKAIDAMEQLTAMTGINTDTNDVVPDIKKAYENFENLFGDPQPEVEENDK